MSFTENLNKLMKENGTSNVALGKAIGVSDMAVLRWRKGEAVPSLDSAVAVAKYYNLSMDQLISEQISLESRNMTKLPIVGEVRHDLISYGLPTGRLAYASNKDIDGYPKDECYVLTGNNKLYFVHQQNMCESGDTVIYKKTDFISEYGIAFEVYGIRRYVRKDDYIELESIYQNEKSIVYRKQEINYLHIVGVVVSEGISYY